jgi:hypothetical protein
MFTRSSRGASSAEPRMIVVHDYCGYRIEVEAIAADGR